MQVYGHPEPPTIHDVEMLLYIQEVELDKFKQELFISNVLENLAQDEPTSGRGGYNMRGLGRNFWFRGRGRSRGGCSSIRSTCQLCGECEHEVLQR